MSYAEELNFIKDTKITDYAIEFAEDIEQDLKDSAEKGYGGYSISLENRDDAHILKDDDFLESLALLLDGCEVKIKAKQYENLIFKNKYHKYELVIEWE